MGALPPLALSVGDPSGIGPEIAVMAWQRRHSAAVSPFYLLVDPALVEARARSAGLEVSIATVMPEEAGQAFAGALPVVPLKAHFGDFPGRSDPANAAGIVEAIDRAVEDTLAGRAAAVVTAPIAKKSLYEAGFGFPGHTEYLAHLALHHTGVEAMPVMMLAGPTLRAVPVTIHIALADVPARLDTDLIVRTGRIVAQDLRERFGIQRPRLAIAGLNPHAGEGGTMGVEDQRIVAPAVALLRGEGVDAVGPLPADTAFLPSRLAGFDALLAMYHDQGLPVLKYSGFEHAVNITLGLPYPRVAVDHGTALEIAGKGTADPSSLFAAVRTCSAMATARTGALSR